MKIKTILATDLKGNSFKHNLKDITIFTGPNGAGKSSRLDCIPLALFGYHPAHKRTNGEILEGLGSGSCMTAAVEFDTGSSISRRWQMNKSTVTCDTEGAIPPSVTPLCIDASEYFGLTERERVKLAFKFSQCATEFGPELVAKVKSLKLDEHDAATEEAIGLVATIIGDDWKLNCQNVSAPEWLETFAEVAKKRCSEAQAGAKRMASTLEGLTELRAQVKQTVNSAAEAQLAELNRELIKLSARHQAASMKLADARAKYARKVELEIHIAGAATSQADWVDLAQEILQLESTIEAYRSRTQELQAALNAGNLAVENAASEISLIEATIEADYQKQEGFNLAVATVNPEGEVFTEIRNLEIPLEVLKKKLEEKASDTESLRIKRDAVSQKLQNAKAAVLTNKRAASTLQVEFDEILSKSCCPFCEASEPGWRAKVSSKISEKFTQAEAEMREASELCKKLVAQFNEADAALAKSVADNTERTELEKQCVQAEHRMSQLKRVVESAKQVISAYQPADISKMQARIELLRKSSSKEHLESLKKQLQESRESDVVMEGHRQRLKACRAKSNQMQSELEANLRLRHELDSLKDITIEAGRALAEEVQRLEAEIANLQAKLQPLTLEVRQANAAKGEVAAKLKAAEAAERVAKEYVVWREVKKLVDEMQVEAVKESMKPILKQANIIAGSILKSKLEYHDGAIGRWSGRKFIGTRSFNRSDQQVTFAAVSVALAAASGSPLKIILMDDLDNVEEKRLKPLFEAIRAAIDAKQISQCIACGVRAKEYAGMEGVEVVEL